MQTVLFETARRMTKEQAISAYRRVCEWEGRAREHLRQTILIPFFGGCSCRLHNCRVNYHYGMRESPVNGKNHKQLAELSADYDYRLSEVFATADRLRRAFAKYF